MLRFLKLLFAIPIVLAIVLFAVCYFGMSVGCFVSYGLGVPKARVGADMSETGGCAHCLSGV